jgi:hypothetical protein
MADVSLLRSGGETWGPVSPDNVQETGVSPVDGLDLAWWPRRRSRSSELEEGPGHRPNPRFLCPSGIYGWEPARSLDRWRVRGCGASARCRLVPAGSRERLGLRAPFERQRGGKVTLPARSLGEPAARRHAFHQPAPARRRQRCACPLPGRLAGHAHITASSRGWC